MVVEVQRNNDRYTVAEVADAIRKAQGIKAAAARQLGCEWETVDSYIRRYKTCEAAYEQASERVLDVAESVVIKAIMDGSIEESKWYLVKKGRKRGYGDVVKQEGDFYLKISIDELARVMHGDNGAKARIRGASEPKVLSDGSPGG